MSLDNSASLDGPIIEKTILSPGKKYIPFLNGTKVKFHYCTKKCDEEKTVIDDSKIKNEPLELIIGKNFKLTAWESAIKTMAVNEVSSFIVDKNFARVYPLVSKVLRDAANPNREQRGHCCAANFQNNGIGYDDLNLLIKEPCDLEFTFELLEVEAPDEYEKETWQLEEEEKLERVPELKSEGNELYNNKEYEKASEKYATALGMLEQLMLKEKPKEKEWTELNQMKLPILLNYAQCKMMLKDYYPVIEHCTTVLQSDKNNVKALYKRGKAHIAVWNCKEAKEDLKKVSELDPKLGNLVSKELRELAQMKKQKDEDDMKKLMGKLF